MIFFENEEDQDPERKELKEEGQGEEKSTELKALFLIKIKAKGEKQQDKVIDLTQAQSELSRKAEEKERGYEQEPIKGWF